VEGTQQGGPLKSAVARPQERKFLGFSFTAGPDIRRTIAPKSLERLKRRIREITRRAKGVSIKATVGELAPYMRGWRGYFGFCETPEVLIALTRWVRLRLRAALWRQWKTPRRRRAALIALRVAGELCNTAGSGRGPCRPEQSPLHRAFQCPLQIARPAVRDRSALAQLLEPPYTDPYVRWCGRGGAASSPLSQSLALWRRRTSRQKRRLTRVKRTRLLARKLCSSM
jgi:hypothetical protein